MQLLAGMAIYRTMMQYFNRIDITNTPALSMRATRYRLFQFDQFRLIECFRFQ
jgi:hypothetical protein